MFSRSVYMVLLFVLGMVCPGVVGAWTLSTPQNDANYMPTANIACAGSGTANTAYVIEVRERTGTTTIIWNSASGTTSSTGDFSVTVNAPGGGWPPGKRLDVALVVNGEQDIIKGINIAADP